MNNSHTPLASLSIVLLAAMFACAMFGFAASLLVAALFYATGPSPESPLIPRFLLKAAVCAAIAAAALYAANRTAKRSGKPQPPDKLSPARPRQWLPLIPPLVLAAAIVFPRLEAYPWAAPDEVHHLVVARNFATLGQYASGHPDNALRPFDTYDSVGPPVILPVAFAFRMFGVDLAAARAVIAAYFLLLCIALYALLKPVMCPLTAALGVLLMTFSFGSVYLARTLYGEVPALAWLVLGLLAWRAALNRPAAIRWALAAGAAFGLAVLCKPILILAAFPFLAVLAYDRIAFRRIRTAHVLAPATTLLLVLAAWWAVQTFSSHDVADAAGGTIGIYKHNFMLGMRSAPRNLAMILVHPFQTIPPILCMALLAGWLFTRRYDPPLAALYFIAIFYAAWWVFFTPGVMPRYLWFSAAVAALFIARVAVVAFLPSKPSRPAKHWRDSYYITAFARITITMLSVAALLPPAFRFAHEIRAVYTADEMKDDYAVSEWVAQLPHNVKISATWPVSGTINLLANRHAETLDSLAKPLPPNNVAIVDTMTRPDILGDIKPERRFGRYAVVRSKE